MRWPPRRGRGPAPEPPYTGTTVLTLEPLSGNWPLINLIASLGIPGGATGPGGTMKHNFGGAGLPWCAWEGYTTREWLGLPVGTRVKRVPYPASITPWSIEQGVAALDRVHAETIADSTGNVLLFAHSQGAQVTSRWIAKPPTTNPDRTKVLLIGNPLRNYGGYGVGKPEVDGRIGQPTPTDTPYHVRDVKMQYDGWADYPDTTDGWAIRNAEQDRIGINGPNAIHCFGYRTARLDDPNRWVYREGNTEFIMLPHPPITDIAPQLIEAGYRRPEQPIGVPA